MVQPREGLNAELLSTQVRVVVEGMVEGGMVSWARGLLGA